MIHLDLFSGIGGFALAARWAGWTTTQFVEIDKHCQKVLNKNFPNIPIHEDIKTFKPKQHFDIITGGFPCQPFSVAGKRKGSNDNRYLWPEMLRVIRAAKPTYVVCENVPGIINMAFDQVCTDLETEGYQVETFIIPACGVGAIHKRNRVWFIAHNHHRNGKKIKFQTGRQVDVHSANGNGADPNNNNKRLSKRQIYSGLEGKANERHSRQNITLHSQWPTQPPICRRNDGVPNRVDRIKSLGNAIVPQVAYEIFKTINSL